MNEFIYVPQSLRDAAAYLRSALARDVSMLPKREFIRAWSAIAYLFPGLHPDGFDDSESGWPRVLKRFAADAWRRTLTDELNENEFYCCDAQWAGLHDQMAIHFPDETQHRVEIAELSARCSLS